MSHTYIYVSPILDKDRPLSALIAEACRELDVMAQLAGAHLTGRPVWTVSEDRLVCTAPARPADPDEDTDVSDRDRRRLAPKKVAQIELLAERGVPIATIARAAGVDWATADGYARRAS